MDAGGIDDLKRVAIFEAVGRSITGANEVAENEAY